MPRTRESEIEQKACAVALGMGVTSVKLAAGGVAGFPDRLFLVPGGSPLFIEFKRPGGVVSAVQQVIIKRLRHYGYRVAVCYTVDAATKEIQAALDAARLPKKGD